MQKTEKLLEQFAQYFPSDFVPKVAIVLGTRLTGLTEFLEDVRFIDFADIKGFPKATGIGHAGRFALGYLCGVPVIVSDGRIHYYEGYSMAETVLGIRLMEKLGAKILVNTNISGAIREDLCVGDFMLIKDHIGLFIPSVLRGIIPCVREDRFVDMGQAYDRELSQIVKEAAQKLDISLKEGVYVQVSGPNYETPAEIKALGLLGADVVGMSTAAEVITARQLGMRVCAVSYISNRAGVSIDKSTRDANLKTAELRSLELYDLIKAVVKEIGEKCL